MQSVGAGEGGGVPQAGEDFELLPLLFPPPAPPPPPVPAAGCAAPRTTASRESTQAKRIQSEIIKNLNLRCIVACLRTLVSVLNTAVLNLKCTLHTREANAHHVDAWARPHVRPRARLVQAGCSPDLRSRARQV